MPSLSTVSQYRPKRGKEDTTYVIPTFPRKFGDGGKIMYITKVMKTQEGRLLDKL
jgi:hypothetical protein